MRAWRSAGDELVPRRGAHLGPNAARLVAMTPTTKRKPIGLRFNVGVPVNIHWSFLAVPLLLLWSGQRPWEYSLAFAGVLLVSVLVHELGHAAAFGAFGRKSSIIVYAPFALTISEDERPLRDLPAVVVALAGPFAGVILGLLALWGQRTGMGENHELTAVLISDTILVSLGYGLLNLVPLLPLDGGQVMQRIVWRVDPDRRETTPHLVSIVIAAICAGIVWRLDLASPGILYVFIGFLAMINFTQLRAARADRLDAAQHDQLIRGIGQLEAGQIDAGVETLRPIVTTLPDGPRRSASALAMAWAMAWRNRPGDMEWVAWLCGLLAGKVDTSFLAALVARAQGRGSEAAALVARGFAVEATEPPLWIADRLFPTSADVANAGAWIDQLDLGERHQGFTRLVALLEHASRRADAERVRELMLRPVG